MLMAMLALALALADHGYDQWRHHRSSDYRGYHWSSNHWW